MRVDGPLDTVSSDASSAQAGRLVAEWGSDLPRYAAVGLLVFAIDFATYWLLVSSEAWFLHAHMIARLVGGAACFLLHRLITFRRRTAQGVAGQAFRYGVLYGAAFVLSGFFVYALVEGASLGPVFGKLGAELLTFLANYSVMKYWVMRNGQ